MAFQTSVVGQMMSVSYTLLTVIVVVVPVLFVVVTAAVASSVEDRAAAASWVSEPDIGAAALMDRPIFSNRFPSLPVFFSCNRSGGGCDRCNCCNLMYCSCNAFCFFNSSWCRCSNCSCLVGPTGTEPGGSGIGGLPQPPPPPPPPPDIVSDDPVTALVAAAATVEVRDPFRVGGLPAEHDDTEPLGEDVVAMTEPTQVVGDATGDLELVRGGGGGGILLFCRSGVRSGTGGLPVSDDVLLNRRSTGFGAIATAVAAADAVVDVTTTGSAVVVGVATVAVAVTATAAATAAVIDGVV